MKIMIITSSPNDDGLTAACGEQSKIGVEMESADALTINLNTLNISACSACGKGWVIIIALTLSELYQCRLRWKLIVSSKCNN